MLFAVLSTVLFLALLVCAWGFTSLITNRDIIDEKVGPLIGPVIAGVACVLVFAAMMVQLRNGRGWLVPLVTAAAVYLLPSLVASTIVALDRVDAAAGLLFFAARVTGPFIPAGAIIAGILVALAPAVTRAGAPRA